MFFGAVTILQHMVFGSLSTSCLKTVMIVQFGSFRVQRFEYNSFLSCPTPKLAITFSTFELEAIYILGRISSSQDTAIFLLFHSLPSGVPRG